MRYIYLLISALVAVTGFAANPKTVDMVAPQIGQRGTTATIQIRGNHLQTAEEILFYQKGIKCVAIRQLDEIPHGNIGPARMIEQEPGKVIEADLEIAPDAPLGNYFFRIRTHKKLSEMFQFWVTPFQVIEEQNAYADREDFRNDTFETAQPVPLNCTITGQTATNENANDIDIFKVKLNKGQRCTCQILNARLGTVLQGQFTDMALEVRTSSGKRLARSSRSFLFAHDPVISFFAPATGDYYITAKQSKDLERHSLHYGLHIGEFARPAVTFPLGGPAGEQVNLDVFYMDGTKGQLTANLPTEVGAFENSMIDITAVTDLPELPSPNKVQVTPFANVMEDPSADIQIIDGDLPIAINGIITEDGEKDWYRVKAKKGQKFRVRTYAMTLGSKLDPFLEIKPAEGTNSRINIKQDDSSWEGHDWEGHSYRHQVKDRLDPIAMFEPDVDGEYLIGISDTRRESGEDYIYRVEFQPHRDSIFTYYQVYPYIPFDYIRDVMEIHRGSHFDRPMMILNGFGSTYNGRLTLEARGLPKGVHFECPTFTKDDRVIQTIFKVGKDVPLSSGTFELVPRALDDGVELLGSLAQTNPVNDQRGSFSPHFTKTRTAAFGILEEAPFDITVDRPKIGLAKNAELDLKINVTRKGDFEAAIYLESTWLPTGVTKQPPLIIPAGETVGYYKLSATDVAKQGKYKVTVTARENEGGNNLSGIGYHYICAPPVEIEVQDPYLEITLERSSIEQGKIGELKGTIKFLREFSGVATAKLLRLPTGVSLVKEPQIAYGQQTAVFPIKVEPDAITGQYKEIACDVKITDAGQEIHQQSGSGVIRIDQTKGKL